MTTSELRTSVDKLKGQRMAILRDIKEARMSLNIASRAYKQTDEAQSLLMHIAEKTQNEIKMHVTGLGSAALNSVFKDGRDLNIDFLPGPRGKMVCPITFLRGPEKIPTNPLEDDSGGACFIAAFGLRCSTHALQRPRTRNTFFMDEPGKDINGKELQDEFAQMIKKVADSGMQFLIVTGVQSIIDIADKVFSFK
jgi:hypothetical protein